MSHCVYGLYTMERDLAECAEVAEDRGDPLQSADCVLTGSPPHALYVPETCTTDAASAHPFDYSGVHFSFYALPLLFIAAYLSKKVCVRLQPDSKCNLCLQRQKAFAG